MIEGFIIMVVASAGVGVLLPDILAVFIGALLGDDDNE